MTVDKLKTLVRGGRTLDQSQAPIVEALRTYLEDMPASFVIPAHKQGHALDAETVAALGADSFRHDVAMLNGLDDIHESLELQVHAQELAAELFGADRCFFLVNGSTLSMQCAITAVARPGEKLLVARNAHKSVISGLIIGGIEPVFLRPEADDDRALTHGIDAEGVRRALEDHRDARGVVVVNPTYYGVASDLAAIAETCHEHGVPLIADDAWGGQFPFHPELPPGALASGADVAVGSFHKSLSGLQQASILSVQGDLVDPTMIDYRVGLVETSSVSSLILASIDSARRELARDGERLLGRALALARHARREVEQLPGLELMDTEVLGRPGAHDLDETKLVIDVSGIGTNGYAVCDWLRTEQRVLVELADHRRVMAVVTLADDEASVARLVTALRTLATRPRAAVGETRALPPPSELHTQLILSPRAAYFADAEHVDIEDSIGRIAAEKVTPYPPGVPVLVPGERITQPIVDYLRGGVALGMNVTDVADSQLDTVRVVA